MANVIIIVYTTIYRKGGEQFPIVAKTLAKEKKDAGFNGEVIARAVESKREVLQLFAETKSAGDKIAEFHFVGHSGMYGPMFGTVAFPEQFSPFEWETLSIPFAENASAYFHCCRSARWFSPFFSRTFNVTTHGFFWYTTFSLSKTRYRFASPTSKTETLYTIGCKGRKSHGLAASIVKFSGLMPAEEMKVFLPQPPEGDTSYNKVAELYDETFSDIKVRQDEWRWLTRHLPAKTDIKLLDIGCGNGALLNSLSGRIQYGVGVDESESMLESARKRARTTNNLEFTRVTSPSLPFNDATFDMAVSLMSFRYLDWDPLMKEIKRVMKPGGVLLIVDMVTVPVKVREFPHLIRDKVRTMLQARSNGEYKKSLARLVSNPAWKLMLKYNPIRSEHEMKWYLESRFPGQKMEILNMGWNARIVAFDSGPVENALDAKLSYP